MRFRSRVFAVLASAAILAVLVPSVSASTPSPFFQGFETNNVGWDVLPGNRTATRVISGTNGVTSKTGGYHAEAFGPCGLDACFGSAFTRWGAYSDTFPAGGYTTSVDIYLNAAGAYANDTRFDWISAINKPDGTHLRDFDFNAGYYDDSDVTGSRPRFVISAGNNAGRRSSYPKNPGHSPTAITASGWYTFQHRFYDGGSGVLAVDLTIRDASSTLLSTWTLSDPLDVIATTVGGNRYGWFASQEFPFLAFDDSELALSGSQVTALSPAHLWVGLKNSDDQGTRFDVKVELIRNAETTALASGLERCVNGVTRNPSSATEAIVVWDAFSAIAVSPGDILSFRVSTRIGTNANDTKCVPGPGGSHNNAVGLRLYYDSLNRDSHFDMTLGGASADEYLHSNGNACVNAPSVGANSWTFDSNVPTAPTGPRCKDSTGINFAGGNLFKEIGTWTMP